MTAASSQNGANAGSSGKGTRTVLLLVFAVFFILGGVTNINDLLVGKFKGMFQLTHLEANLVQFAFFTSYALFSIPAGIVMSRLGYIRTFVLGFAIIAVAALLFIPAAHSGAYLGFLAALFMIGAGITVLQVAMNPVVTTLGPVETSHSRLTFAQAFNSIGVFLMVRGGAELLLGDSKTIDAATATPAQLDAFRITEGAVIGQAYLGLAIVMVLIGLVFWSQRRALDHAHAEDVRIEGTLGLFLHNPRVRFGALCIFTYVGAEVAIGSNLIAYLGDKSVMGLSLLDAGRLVAYYWGGAMIGRLVGGFVLRMFRPGRVLTAYALAAITLIAISAFTVGTVSGWALILVGFCNSLMFPTIFSLATEGLTEEAPQASGIMCTAIVGGALVPLTFGWITDLATIRTALVVPVICYAVIATFGVYALRGSAKSAPAVSV
jgi:FHS family L-fucose permease-like MFS transporter